MKKSIDLENKNVALIITGLLGMVEEERLTPHEAFGVVEKIKRECYFALLDIYNGKG